MVKNLPAVKEIWVPSLGREDPLEKGMSTHFSILAWKIPWTEEPGGHSPWGLRELAMTEVLALSLFTFKELQVPFVDLICPTSSPGGCSVVF